MENAKHNELAKTGAPADDNSSEKETSRNREESMGESTDDALGKQTSASSGTTPLSGETSDSNEKTTPGGVEGVSGNS